MRSVLTLVPSESCPLVTLHLICMATVFWYTIWHTERDRSCDSIAPLKRGFSDQSLKFVCTLRVISLLLPILFGWRAGLVSFSYILFNFGFTQNKKKKRIFVWVRVSLCSLVYPGSHSLPDLTFGVLRCHACTTWSSERRKLPNSGPNSSKIILWSRQWRAISAGIPTFSAWCLRLSWAVGRGSGVLAASQE